MANKSTTMDQPTSTKERLEINELPLKKQEKDYLARATASVVPGIIAAVSTIKYLPSPHASAISLSLFSASLVNGLYNLMRFGGIDESKSLIYSICATELGISTISALRGQFDISSLLPIVGATAVGGLGAYIIDQRGSK